MRSPTCVWASVEIPLESGCGERNGSGSVENKIFLGGGRITLIKAVLANLVVYFMSLFRCPMLVLDRLEKFERDFLWQGREPKKKFHLVD